MAKALRRIFFGGVVLCILSFVFVGSGYWYQTEEDADCAVVFGARVWSGNQPSHALYDRIMTGFELYRNNQVNCLVLSGGPSQNELDHEVDVMQRVLLNKGGKSSDLVLDYEGVDTQSTIQNLVLDKSYIMVSNDFHMARIRLFGWKSELGEVYYQKSSYQYGRYLKEWYFFIREMVAVLWYVWQ